MGRELDRRSLVVDEATPARVQELQRAAELVSAELPGDHTVHVARFDRTTGVPRVVASEAAPAERGRYVERALEHVAAIAPVLGLESVTPEYRVDEQVQLTGSGAASVHLQQQHGGVPIFQATETVRFNPDGSLMDAAGSSTPVGGPAEADPRLPVVEAVERAAAYVAEPHSDELGHVDQFGESADPAALDLTGFEPTVVEQDAGPTRAAVFAGAPFEDVRAALIWFPLGDGLRLSWDVLLTFPDYLARYRVVVDAGAEPGELLYCRQLARSVAARGNVYRVDGSQSRALVDFPLPLSAYPALPVQMPPSPGFPAEWVVAEETEGNCTRAHLGDNGAVLRGVEQAGSVIFDPADATGDDQKVLNIFFYNCFMHDFTYLLGFREPGGNFQRDNHGRGGRDGDPVDARAHAGPVRGTANMLTLEDGRSPVMNMGLVSRTNRHTAFDSTVVFHEFMHGVTNRMVGGPADSGSLSEPQSAGMGEGWSDWIACTINHVDVVGAWVVGRPGGIRSHRYDGYPNHFGDLGTPPFTADNEHALGEIWCATLLDLNRALGAPLALRLVIDALRLSAANPGFLDMRDDILLAARQMQEAGQLDRPLADVEADIWKVFAARGMGPRARSQGAQVAGIVADFEPPPT